MSDQQHPIIPSPELVEQWRTEWCHTDESGSFDVYVATRAAQWGADHELEACCEVIKKRMWFANPTFRLAELRANRRPKPPSVTLEELSKQVEELDRRAEKAEANYRHALERLQQLEEQQ